MIESALIPVVADRIWALERPVWFSGARLRTRTTVVRLDDGGLLIHTPPPPTDALAEQLRALGPVRWLMVPNCWHHLGAPAAAARFPEARVVGPASALDRNKALRLHVDIRDPGFGAQLPEFEVLPLQGVPFWDETVLYHRPSQTLLGADIACSASAKDHWTWRCGARLTGCYDRVRVPPDARKKIVDRAAAARSLRAMLEHPAERLIIGHGEIIERGCRDQLAQAWRLEGLEL
jgi:glyoxylase-like metal-dependent hydrolase (beta-lactamase superfamily II)